jgi:two-component system, LytTR family, response regulator
MDPLLSRRPVMPYRTLIVDDEPVARAGLRRMLGAHPEIIVIGEAKNGAEATVALRSERPDLVLLDIHMPECNGFEALSQCLEHERPAIVCVTAHARYAVQAFDFRAVDYVLKPFDERVAIAVHRAVQFLGGAALTDANRHEPFQRRLVVRDRDRLVFVEPRAVSWFEASGNYVQLMVNGSSLLMRGTLNAVQAQLDPTAFLRISRSIVVNVNAVDTVERHPNGQCTLRLSTGRILRSSRRYRHALWVAFGERGPMPARH